ncbi:CYTH and CHAD domain-containing protein [Mycobacterium angelicum]|uniref:CHAD domain-containing protein n=1 Tax=Mycobacterium angelicum TaxID=470074 RepID=A0A1W9ZI66_MYCAN|nr:CYTH and CHAD domain-containing protein [Mycobacterium angelicum]MCV7199401.1 CYTH and CHAD domain-containing protein [Mycobacterium angelicum]ORA15981.1 hypothetical protein BST12_21290 [Mycobacterium angelicum]
MHGTLERHATWDVDDRFVLPAPDGLLGKRVRHDSVDETVVYYDTPDHDLRAFGVSLHRHDGDGTAGWRLEIPVSGGHTELRWPPSDHPPAEAIGLLTGLTAGKGLVDIVKIHTLRERYRRTKPRLEVDDDRVRASVGARLLAWREIDVDADGRDRSAAKRIGKRLRAAGARPSRYSSKLAHVAPAEPVPAGRAAAAFVDYLNAQIDQIAAGDIGLRRGRDPIHDTRVAIRRVRSTLRVFAPVLDEAIGDMDGELRWFAGLLGDVRDCRVQQHRFGDAIDGLPDELVLGPVKARIGNDLQAVELPARAAVREAMDSERYLAIVAVLRRWRTQPPVAADVTTAKLRKRVRGARRKADRRLVTALGSQPQSGQDHLLHRARKAAKRARYAAELCRPLHQGAKRKTKRYKQIQRVLGNHQDTVVATEALRKMAIAAGTTPGENGFTYGMLYARERHIADQCRQEARQLG